MSRLRPIRRTVQPLLTVLAVVLSTIVAVRLVSRVGFFSARGTMTLVAHRAACFLRALRLGIRGCWWLHAVITGEWTGCTGGCYRLYLYQKNSDTCRSTLCMCCPKSAPWRELHRTLVEWPFIIVQHEQPACHKHNNTEAYSCYARS